MAEPFVEQNHDNESSLLGEHPQRKAKVSDFAKVTATMGGVQFGWALQIALATPLFRLLGKDLVNFFWLVGPVSGLIVQPIVGTISDTFKHPMGRRRPFIIAGAIAIAIGLLLISNGEPLGYLVGDTSNNHPWGITICAIGFCLLDFANNFVQLPLRALLVDVVPRDQLIQGNNWFNFMLGQGNILGFLAGAAQKYILMALPFFVTSIRAAFMVSILFLTITVTITCMTTKEKPYTSVRVRQTKWYSPFVSIYRHLGDLPSGMKRVCLMQLVAWVAWFVFLIHMTDWVGENVFQGDADAPEGSHERQLYQDGVEWGSLSLSVYSGVSMLYSLFLDFTVPRLGERVMYTIGQLVMALAFLGTLFVNDKWSAMIVISSLGIPWATTMVIPFSIVGRVAGDKLIGIYQGVFNMSVVLPQFVVAFSIGYVIDYYDGNLESAMMVAAAFAFLSAFVVQMLNFYPPTHVSHINDEDDEASA